jgi:hypothetical protein
MKVKTVLWHLVSDMSYKYFRSKKIILDIERIKRFTIVWVIGSIFSDVYSSVKNPFINTLLPFAKLNDTLWDAW